MRRQEPVYNPKGTSRSGGGSGSRDGGDSDAPKPLGVPEDYTAMGPEVNMSGMGARAAEGWSSGAGESWGGVMGAARSIFGVAGSGGGQGHGSVRAVQPRYYEGDEFTNRPRSPERISELQTALAQSGILTESFIPGVWDQNTAQAWSIILGTANANGLTAQQAMTQMLANGGSTRWNPETGQFESVGGGGAGTAPPQLVTRTTDPKVLGSIFRQAAIDTMGIGWGQGEIDRATAAFNEVERQRQRDMYNAQTAAGQMGVAPGETPVEGNVVDIPSPEGFIDAYMREKDPEAVAEERTMDNIQAFMDLAGGTGWGVGRQI